MKLRGSAYVLIAFMVVMLILVTYSLTMPHLKSKLLPVVLGSGVFVLSAIRLWIEIKAGSRPKAAVSKGGAGEKEEGEGYWRRYLLNIGWVAGFILATYVVGFIITMPLFLLLYMKWLGTRWLVALAFAVITPLILFGVFEFALNVELYRGLLFGG